MRLRISNLLLDAFCFSGSGLRTDDFTLTLELSATPFELQGLGKENIV